MTQKSLLLISQNSQTIKPVIILNNQQQKILRGKKINCQLRVIILKHKTEIKESFLFWNKMLILLCPQRTLRTSKKVGTIEVLIVLFRFLLFFFFIMNSIDRKFKFEGLSMELVNIGLSQTFLMEGYSIFNISVKFCKQGFLIYQTGITWQQKYVTVNNPLHSVLPFLVNSKFLFYNHNFLQQNDFLLKYLYFDTAH